MMVASIILLGAMIFIVADGYTHIAFLRKSASLQERLQFRVLESVQIVEIDKDKVRERSYSNGTTILVKNLKESIENSSFVKLLLSFNKTGGKKALNTLEDLNAVKGRFVKLKSDIKVQLQYSYSTNDKTFNYSPLEAQHEIDLLIGLPRIKKVTLVTMKNKLDLMMNSKGGILKTTELSSLEEEFKAPIDFSHDRHKNNLISMDDPFLHALKITTIEKESSPTKISLNGKLKLKALPALQGARPRAGMSDKYRQIQNFVEILDGLVSKSQLSSTSSNSQSLAYKPTLKVVDMGSGLAYLTFAVHRHFSKFFNLQTVGVESRPNLVEQSTLVARSLGDDFSQLSFVQNEIMEYINQQRATTTSSHDTTSLPNDKIDILIALHACDTATDEAIFCGIQSGSDIIVTAPCCQKQVRRQMDLHLKKKNELSTGQLSELLSFGIFREREAEMVTGNHLDNSLLSTYFFSLSIEKCILRI